MTSRSTMLFSLFGLAAVAGGVLWFTQVRSTSTVTVPGAPSQTASETTAAASDHELAEPGRVDRAAPQLPGNAPAAPDKRQASDPKAPKPYAAGNAVVVAPEHLQPKTSEAVVAES